MYKYGGIEFDGRRPQRVEPIVVERDAEVGADVRTDEPEVADSPPQLGHGDVDVLHRELGESPEAIGMAGDDTRQLVVVPATETGCDVRLDVVEVGDRVRRQHLQLDAEVVVEGQPAVDVHERRTPVVDTVEDVVADPEPRPTRGPTPSSGP